MFRSTLLLLGAMILAACGQPADSDPAVLAVAGQAEVRAAPDRARFTATVLDEGEAADAVMAANSERSERMLAALREAGVASEALRTTGIRLHPVWTPRPRNAGDDWQPRISGYQARNQIEVTSDDLAAVGELIAVAVRAGANELGSIEFTLEDQTVPRTEAIRLATARALAEARTLAEAAGARPGDIIELQLDEASSRPPVLRAAMDARAEFAAVPVEPGELRIGARVTLRMTLD